MPSSRTAVKAVGAKTTGRKAGASPPVARKRAQRPALRDVNAPVGDDAGSSAAPEAAFPHLRATEDPGVFLNPAGKRVNAQGILLSAVTAPAEPEEELAQRLLGGPADTPAKVLKLMALNTALPLTIRIDAAKSAAPYFDKKVPVAVETNPEESRELDMLALAKLPREKRLEMLAALRELGVNIGGKDGA